MTFTVMDAVFAFGAVGVAAYVVGRFVSRCITLGQQRATWLRNQMRDSCREDETHDQWAARVLTRGKPL